MNTIIGIKTEKKPAYYEIITPKIAKNILNNNTGNRKVAKNKVLDYYNEMINGKFKEGTAEPLKISDKGRLLDGQHRLHALIKANMNIEFLVARDLKETIFDVLDTGKTRGAADALSFSEVPNTALTAAILKIYFNTKNKNNERYKLSNSEVVELYYTNPTLHSEITNKAMSRKKKGKLLNSSVIGGLLLVFMEKNEAEAESFFEQLCRVKPVKNSTVEVLYQLLLRDALSKTTAIPPQVKIRLIIKAWNAFRVGKELKIIKYIESDGFPEIL